MAADERPQAARGTLELGLLVNELVRALTRKAEDLIQEAVRSELAKMLDCVEERVLLDREGLAKALSCSVGTIDGLRKRGMPELRVADGAPRFEPKECVEWIRRMNEASEAADG